MGRARGQGTLVSARGADEDASSFSISSVCIDMAGGSGNLFNARGAGKNASLVFTTISLSIVRAGGPGCLVSVGGVDVVGVSNEDVNLGIGWAGDPVDQLYTVFAGNTDNFSKKDHQFNKDETREKKSFVKAYEAVTKGRQRMQKLPTSSNLFNLSKFFIKKNWK